MPDKPLIDLKKLEEYSQSPPKEWMVENADGTKYGPFAWKELELFATQRRLVAASKIMHPVKTRGAWISPSKAPAIWKLIKDQDAIQASEATVKIEPQLNATGELLDTPNTKGRPDATLSKSFGLLSRYLSACGKRSAIFQILSLAWTLITGLVCGPNLLRLYYLRARTPYSIESYPFEVTESDVDRWIFVSQTGCVFMWSILFVPMVFAAILTLDSKQNRG